MAEELPQESDRSREGDKGSKVPAPSYNAPRVKKDEAGFFTVYKPGQGYWTRIGTLIGAALIAVFSVTFLFQHIPVWLNAGGVAAAHVKSINIGICVAYLAVYALIIFRLTNKPRHVDFLIATDAEMKKVNWTSKKELIGSTKVVIIFMLLIAFLLFGFDVVFGYFFHLIGVLQTGPFG